MISTNNRSNKSQQAQQKSAERRAKQQERGSAKFTGGSSKHLGGVTLSVWPTEEVGDWYITDTCGACARSPRVRLVTRSTAKANLPQIQRKNCASSLRLDRRRRRHRALLG